MLTPHSLNYLEYCFMATKTGLDWLQTGLVTAKDWSLAVQSSSLRFLNLEEPVTVTV